MPMVASGAQMNPCSVPPGPFWNQALPDACNPHGLSCITGKHGCGKPVWLSQATMCMMELGARHLWLARDKCSAHSTCQQERFLQANGEMPVSGKVDFN